MGNARNIAFWVVLFLMILMLFNLFSDGASQMNSRQISYSNFIERVENDQVATVTIDGEDIFLTTSDGGQFSTVRPQGEEIAGDLIAKNVEVRVEPQQQSGFMSFLGVWLPFILLIGVWIFFMNRMQGGGKGGAMGFGKSRAKLLTEKHGRVTFDDVAGIDEAKEELEEIVEFLRNPQKFSRLGGKIPKGALLVGPPGTGKTLLARAIAGEAGVPFFTISGSDFVEMFVGVGASRVRDMFEQAKKSAPCIVFIDEIDAVGRARGVGIGGGNDEREQTLNQRLSRWTVSTRMTASSSLLRRTARMCSIPLCCGRGALTGTSMCPTRTSRAAKRSLAFTRVRRALMSICASLRAALPVFRGGSDEPGE